MREPTSRSSSLAGNTCRETALDTNPYHHAAAINAYCNKFLTRLPGKLGDGEASGFCCVAQALIAAEEGLSLWTLLRPDEGGGQLQAVGGAEGVAIEQRGGEASQRVVRKNLSPALSQQRKPGQRSIAFG